MQTQELNVVMWATEGDKLYVVVEENGATNTYCFNQANS